MLVVYKYGGKQQNNKQKVKDRYLREINEEEGAGIATFLNKPCITINYVNK